ncbi:lipid A biosynthesis lauroyl acyltransferase [Kaistia dalseonensis]|uniref:KDO2-lipid IV(A) lauroyltransferase n=1 Tax=Kaistia dalseonensis TaxID=410840 RepID=A0ABU0H5T5_9HYPH|nr:lipid A biosynthesis lauroyl acyltransferase [Kaistia dalseonensis]MCX5495093.1 lipid A biosynthesis lauroyl acyltransferase [Kaistia dalseonensis]MDQ0437675.1 KDO2-lipid IV(A) lauroyltransferase [Kaistia dalseonensis]
MATGIPSGRKRPFKNFVRSLSRSRATQVTVAAAVRGLIGLIRALGPERAGRVSEAVTVFVGRFVPESKLALRNLAAAFPEKTEAEREAILEGVWRNLGRTVAEYVHLDQLVDIDPEHLDRCRTEVVGLEYFLSLRDDGKPGIVFSAHLANWEILAVVAARFGLPVVALFRAPTNNVIAQDLIRRREELMGKLIASGRGATFEVAAALDRGEHLGILTDQHHGSGPRVPFFGRMVAANPLVARLARQYDCPVHGARTIRLPDGRFRVELTPPLDMPRDAEGLVDVTAGTAAVMAVVEGWVREHPEQWLWLHNRWR